MRNIFVSLMVMCCFTGAAQNYFNNTYNNSAYFAELSSHISVLSNETFLVPTISTVSGEGYFYNWRILGADGSEISEFNLMDTTGQFFAGAGDNFASTLDNCFVQSQLSDKAGLIKFSQNGSIIWQIAIDSLNGGTLDFTQLSDTSIFFSGSSYGSNSFNSIKTNSAGEIIQHTYLMPFENAEFLWLDHSMELENKSLVHGGFVSYLPGDVYFNTDGAVIKTDSLGNLLWAKHWDDDLNDQKGVFCPGNTDTTLIVTTKKVDWYQDDMDHDPYTARMGTMMLNSNTGDTSEVVIVDILFGNPYVNEILRSPEGGYIIMGWANDEVHTFTFLMKLDGNRQLEWYKKYSPEPPEIDPSFSLISYDIEITADSGFVVCGAAIDLGNNGLNKQMPWIFKTDQCGELEWNNCGAIGISSLPTEPFQFKLFPNPANESLTIALTANTTQKMITVIDATGRVVRQATIYPHVEYSILDILDLENGVYVVRLIDENRESVSKRFVKE